MTTPSKEGVAIRFISKSMDMASNSVVLIYCLVSTAQLMQDDGSSERKFLHEMQLVLFWSCEHNLLQHRSLQSILQQS